MHSVKFIRTLFVVFFINLLAACGGSDSTVPPPPPPPPTADTQAPVIQLVGEITVELFVGDEYVEAGATVSDNVDTNLNYTVEGEVDTSTAGTYILEYRAQDNAGNQASPVQRIVIVTLPPDTSAPVITLNGESEVSLFVGTEYVEQGASATDDRDGSVDVSITGSVDVDTVGDYTLTYNAQDNAGNVATPLTRTVSVVLPPDTTAPVITLNGESTVSILVGTEYEELGATATDDRDDQVEVTISGNIDTGTVGNYVLTYNAQDSAGNAATPVTRTVSVTAPADPIALSDIGDLNISIGSTLNLALETTGQAVGALRYAATPIPLPANALFDSTTGIFSFTPASDQAGTYNITFSVTDGFVVSSEPATITVAEIDQNANTQFNGRLLDSHAFAQGQTVPIRNATVSLLNSTPVQVTTTDSNGFFSFTDVDVVDQVLDLNTATAALAPDGSTYARFREKIELIANTNNVISRPFYLPRIAPENQTQVDPSQTTMVKNDSLGIELEVYANTALNDDGSLFTGNLSITDVPDGLAPAQLPRSFRPADLVTIQPVGVRFDTPVPITFPNTDNLPPGDEVDIWSIDPETGEFVIVALARVSDDGSILETVSGGIVAADWHFPAPRQAQGTTTVNDQNNENIDTAGSDNTCIGSSASLQGGCLTIAHDLVSYRSLDQDRGLRISYSSETANPYPAINVGSSLDSRTALPEAFQVKLTSVAGITQDVSQFVTAQRDETRHSLQFDATEIPTGSYPYEMEIASEYAVSGVSTFLMDSVLVHNRINSPIGAGWAIDGLQQVHPINGSDRVVITEGNSAIRLFTPQDENGDRNTDLIIAIDGSGSLSSSEFSLQLEGIAAAIENPLNIPHNSNVSFGVVQFSNVAVVEIALTNIDSLATAQSIANQVRSIVQIDRGTEIDDGIDVSVQEFIDNGREDVRQVLIVSTDGKPSSESDSLNSANNAIAQGIDEISAIGVGSGADLEFLETMIKNGSVFGVSDFNEFALSIGQNLRVIVGGSPAGEFSFVRRNPDSSLTRVMKDGTTIEFNSAGYQTATIDRNGNTTTFNYDGNNNLTSIVDPVGRTTTLAYASNRLSTITLPDGRVTRFTHDAEGNLLEIQDPDGSKRQFNYGEKHLISSQVSKRGFSTEYIYDHKNRVVGSVWPDGSQRAIAPSQTAALVAAPEQTTKAAPAPAVGENEALTRFTDGVGNNTTYLTDRFGRITTMTDAIGRTTVMQRDANGQVTRLTRPNGATVAYTYDQNGNLLTQTEESINAVTRFAYEPTYNQVTSITDPKGNVTSFNYDENGNLTSQVDALGNTRSFTYNSRGQVVTETDERGNVTTYAYFSNGNLQSITDALGEVTNYQYDVQGNVSRITDRRGNATTFTYDDHNRLIEVLDPSGAITTTTYDTEGNVASVTNPTGEVVTTSYDELNRPTQVNHPITGVTTTAYDGNGRITSITDAKGNVTRYSYDEANQLVDVTNALGNVETFTYDALGSLATATDAKGNTTTFDYDDLGRVTERRDPSFARERYEYDVNNNLIGTQTRKNGLVLSAYDALNRVIQTDTSSDGFFVENRYLYTYDEAGNTVFISDADSSLSYNYDALNRLTTETITLDPATNPRTTTLTHTLDAEGNRTGLASTLHTVDIGYQYDNRNLLSQLTTNNGRTVGFAYDASARLTSINFPNSASSAFSFDNNGRLNSIEHTAQQNLDLSYDYDVLGNIIGITEPTKIRNFEYDAIQQLLSGGTNAVPENYSYDAAYNRTSSHQSATNTHDENNRLTQDTQFSYVYDDNGNLIQKTDLLSSQVTEYSWDAQNQLIAVNDGTNSITYAYDGLGRRIGKTVNGVTTDYFYDGDHILIEQLSTGELKGIYHHGAQIDQILVREDATNSYYYYADHLGSVRQIIRNGTEVSNTYEYDAYGNITSSTGSAHNPFLFTGREYDAETGLYYYRARYYDSNAGRFISEDPLLFIDGLNINAYVGNNPLNAVDPFGTMSSNSGGSSSGGNACFGTGITSRLNDNLIAQQRVRVDIGYTNAVGHSLHGQHHALVVVTDPSTGEQFAVRAGPSGGLGSGHSASNSVASAHGGSFSASAGNGSSGGFGFGSIHAEHGQFNETFRDPPSLVHTLQHVGYLNASINDVKAMSVEFVNVTNANELPYRPLRLNSNSFAFTFVESLGFNRPKPNIKAVGSQNGRVSGSLSYR